jgi:hypothetical protein
MTLCVELSHFAGFSDKSTLDECPPPTHRDGERLAAGRIGIGGRQVCWDVVGARVSTGTQQAAAAIRVRVEHRLPSMGATFTWEMRILLMLPNRDQMSYSAWQIGPIVFYWFQL